ncbi:MAG: hypothetical protein L3J14_00595 [Flavobacteriaceae bacterium]|nr:hypothetical protein [Flavobacteriaceae bacterium]
MTLLKDADDKQIKFENYYFEALKYKAIGNYSRAITELEKCQQLFPDDKSVVFELSKNYFHINKTDEAALYIENALENDSKNYWFLEHAKKVYLKQYNYPKAIETQEKIVAQNPKKTEDLVLIYLQAKEYKNAKKTIELLESKHQFSSRLERFKQMLSNYYGKKSVVVKQAPTSNTSSLSLENLKKSFKKNQEYKVLKEILSSEFTNKNFDNLLIYSNKGLDLFPAQPMIYLMNAKSLVQNKKYNEAIDVLNNGIDFVVDDTNLEIDFYEQFAQCYEALNQVKEAKKYLDKVNRLKNNINK